MNREEPDRQRSSDEQALHQQRARVERLRAQHQATLSEIKSARARATDMAWELEELEQRLRDLLAQREGPADPLLEREIASMTSRQAALEEQTLRQMLQIDELAARYSAEEQALAEALQTLTAYEARLRDAPTET